MGSSVILPVTGQPKTGPDPSFKTPALPNVVGFGFKGIDPPTGFYVQRDDTVTLHAMSQLAGDTVTINVRILLPYAQAAGQPDHSPDTGVAGGPIAGPGYIQTIQQVLQIPNVLTPATLVFNLTEGYLLSISCVGSSSQFIGQTFAQVWLTRGAQASLPLNSFNMLAAGYVTSRSVIGWPGMAPRTPVDGPGFMGTYAPANPAAGSDLNVTSAGPGRVRLQAFRAQFTASAAVANRFPSFSIADTRGPRTFYTVQDTTAVTAGQTVVYSLAAGATLIRGGGVIIDVTFPIPSPLVTGFAVNINTTTGGIQAADQWTNITFTTEEWIELN